MKDYKRLTDRDGDGIPYVKCADCYIRDKCDLTEEVCYQELQDRLAEIEDKIERGELVSTVQDERSEQEIAFFVKHNVEVRKQAVKEFAERVKMAFYYEFDELIPSIMADKIDELVKEVCKE